MPSPSSAADPRHSWSNSYSGHLLELLVHPERAVPRLAEEQGTLSLVGFPAVSGVVVAYMLAKGLSLGDRFGFWPVAIGVVLGGALLGMIALWFAGALPQWGAVYRDAGQEQESARLFAVFSDATWPFLPLLLIVAPLELYYYGTDVFSADRGVEPTAVVWLVRALVVITIGLWLVMMVRGTAVVRRETERAAGGELARWGLELLAIAVLFVLILMVSLMYW